MLDTSTAIVGTGLAGLMTVLPPALDRRESRDGHHRTDWRETDPRQAGARSLTLAEALRRAAGATPRVAA